MNVKDLFFTAILFFLASVTISAHPSGPVAQTQATINVKQFGATGDGQHDDTDAINKALLILGEHGGSLYFPPGLYLSKTISITSKPYTSIIIRGEKGKTIIRRTGGRVALFFSESLNSRLVFRDLILDGASDYSPSKWTQERDGTLLVDDEVNGIYVYNASSLEVYACVIKKFHGKGIAAFSTDRFIARDNKVTEVNNSGINGHRVNYMEVTNNKIFHTGFVPDSFYLRGKVFYRKTNKPVTRFGDGIEAECDRLLATGNTIVNPGRCGIVHDLGKDLGYKTRSADIRRNAIRIDSEDILNNNPPAGIWCEQTGDLVVSQNSIYLIRCAAKVISGIRFFNTDGRINCQDNIIDATKINQQMAAAISVLEPTSEYAEISGNQLTGRFKSGIAVSYERDEAYLGRLLMLHNLVNLYGHTTGLLVTVKSTKKFPAAIGLTNNQFSGAGLNPFYFAVYGGKAIQKNILGLQNTGNTLNKHQITKEQSKALSVIAEMHE